MHYFDEKHVYLEWEDIDKILKARPDLTREGLEMMLMDREQGNYKYALVDLTWKTPHRHNYKLMSLNEVTPHTVLWFQCADKKCLDIQNPTRSDFWRKDA